MNIRQAARVGTMQDYETLVQQAQDTGNEQREEAFGELIAAFEDRAQAWAYDVLGDAHQAQDVAQEAFLTAYQKIDQLRDPAAFPAWLKRIVLTHSHRVTRRKSPSLLPLDDDAAPQPDPAADAEERDLEEQVSRAVRALPEHERVVTELFYITGYSQQEIAERLEVPLTTVKKRLQYAREHLRETMPTMMLNTASIHYYDGAELAYTDETLRALAILQMDMLAIA